MPDATNLDKTPALIGTLSGIKEQMKYYADLNSQLNTIGHRIHNTEAAPSGSPVKESLPRAIGLLSDLQEIHEFMSVQNTILQDTINKLTGLI